MKLPFNPRNPKTQLLVAAVVLLLLAGLATMARADPYAQSSAGSAIVRGEAAAIDLAIVYPEAGPGDSSYAVGVTLIGESTFQGATQRNNFAWRAELVDGFGRFDVGIGVAVMQNEDAFNSCDLQFTLALGYRLRRWPVTVGLRHFSNSGTCSPNKGRDLLLVGWRFR